MGTYSKNNTQSVATKRRRRLRNDGGVRPEGRELINLKWHRDQYKQGVTQTRPLSDGAGSGKLCGSG